VRAVLNTFQPESTRIKASPKRENLIKTKDQYRLRNFFQNFKCPYLKPQPNFIFSIEFQKVVTQGSPMTMSH